MASGGPTANEIQSKYIDMMFEIKQVISVQQSPKYIHATMTRDFF